MPSIAQSRREVHEKLDEREGLVDHDAILASLEDEIVRHNAAKEDLRDTMRRSRRSQPRGEEAKPMRFRFKDGSEAQRKRRKHHSRQDEYDHESRHGRKRKSRRKRKGRRKHADDYPTPPGEEAAAHPFPREPTALDTNPAGDSDIAFRTSLFDALADDEGAAAYWEDVYGQPIHVYPRAPAEDPMSDNEYVEFVKQQMWKRKHPEIVQERQKREKEKKVEEEERTRRREEFVRRKEQAAWERAQRGPGMGRDEKKDYDFVFSDPPTAFSASAQRDREQYVAAWNAYIEAWQRLKKDFLARDKDQNSASTRPNIPYPVRPGQAVKKANIEAFMRYMPGAQRVKELKAERVLWHPDKMQQRFGALNERTKEKATLVFRVVDGLLEEERKRE